MFTVATVLNALELGFIYALVAMALFLSFRVLNIADMTTDGAFTLGCAVSATAAVAGHPFLGLPLAMLAGAAAGFITAFLQTKLAVLAQYQRSADINLGTGMVVIGLASLIIGETLFGRGGMWVKAVAAVAGSVIYRFIIALALRANVPSECLKLISAVIVALAIAAPALKAKADFRRRRANAQKGGARHA